MQKNKAIILLIIIGFIVYFNIFFNGFVWDDQVYLLNNPILKSIKNFYLPFLGINLNVGGGTNSMVYYRPLTSLYTSIVYSTFGSNAFFFHFFQLIIHIINSVLVYLIFSKLFKNVKYLPIFLSLIFLVHPINVEAVSWISAIQEVLFVMFCLITFFLVLRLKDFKIKHIIIINLLIFASILIKETGALFYVIVFVYFLLFNKKAGASLHVFFSSIFVFIYGFIRLFTINSTFSNKPFSSIMNASLLERFQTIPKAISFYLKTFFYPKDLAISQHWVVKNPDFYNFTLPLLIILVFITLCLIYILKTRDKLFSFFFIWLMLGLGIHSQIIPLSMTVAERWFYFPIIGALGMIGVVIQRLNLKNFYLINGVLLLIISLLSVRSYVRTLNWKSGLVLYSHDIKINKTSYDLENNLGVELGRIGKIDEAGQHFKKSTQLAPFRSPSWTNLADYYKIKGDNIKAELCFKRAVNNSNSFSTYEKYTKFLIKQKKYQEAKNLLENKALKYYPNNKSLKIQYKTVLDKLNDKSIY